MQRPTEDTKNRLSLPSHLKTLAKKQTRPDGSAYFALSYQDEHQLVKSGNWSHKDVQICALENNIVPERYARNQNTLGNQEQLRLLRSHVAIIGLGGLGGTVTEILARIGIGTLTLVDGDHFEDSNLNRQLLSSVDVLGQKKADVAARRVTALNPAIEIHSLPLFFSAKNGTEILEHADIAVDCLDTITDRFILEGFCKKIKIPMVSAAIGGTSGQATVIFPNDAGLQRIYGTPENRPQKGIEATLGTLPFAAIAMAAVECAEIVALAIGRPSQLHNKMVLADFTYHSMDIMAFD